MFFIKPTLNGATFDITLKNYGSKKKQFNLYTDIIDKETGAILYSGLSIRKLRLNAGEERMETYTVNDLKPRLWTPQHPNLYDFKFRLVTDKGVELDCLTMSTGYPNNETGHPTRSYQLIHQNPYTLIGYEAYDWADPASFLKTQAFITGELAETLRHSNDQASGIMHFALMTWFRQTYDYQNIEPYPTYYALKRALQPVLVSAELWGRNLYVGEKLPTRIYVVNDRENGTDLQPSLLRWEIQDETGKCLASGKEKVPLQLLLKPDMHFDRNPNQSHEILHRLLP